MIKNLIFDMGNVIIDIDVPATYRAFADLAGITEEKATGIFDEKQFYFKLEIGETDNAGFRNLLRESFGEKLTDDEIDSAWCGMLKYMPKERLDRIQELGKSYRVFLLSNTNSIHIKEVKRRAAASGHDFLSLFETPFFSYEMGFMKPDPDFYLEALKQADLKAEETVFIDDNFDNIESAKTVGIETIWLNPLGSILEKMKEY
ncbi:HAD family hydrolase [Dyadobacter subterraneus]|uniref:HAD family phosphatase n=1 Tax=Dyadobacter subterraneus TaxID=2773304 RepID=A0ABR9W6G2_9BACT|nr:HAD family phosphatase [Dyadobacter subterraneus]MBE9460561.1 HAD family phosphatase [Dyadobacter subterraneus]